MSLVQYGTIWYNMKQSKWWRRRESNPRPKAFHLSLYVRSPGFFYFRLMIPTQAGNHEASLLEFHCLDAGHPSQLSCLTVTHSKRAGALEWALAVLCSQCVLVFRVGVCIFSRFLRGSGPRHAASSFYTPVESSSPPEFRVNGLKLTLTK